MKVASCWGDPRAEIISQELRNNRKDRRINSEYLQSMISLNRTIEEFYKKQMENKTVK